VCTCFYCKNGGKRATFSGRVESVRTSATAVVYDQFLVSTGCSFQPLFKNVDISFVQNGIGGSSDDSVIAIIRGTTIFVESVSPMTHETRRFKRFLIRVYNGDRIL